MPVGSGIPVKIYELSIPILLNVLDDISKQSSTMVADVIKKQIESNIPNSSPCNDLELQALIDRLNALIQRMDNFNNLLNKIPDISGILTGIGATAKAISVYLTISGTPVAPAPLVKALDIISALAVNAVSVAKLLSGITTEISIQLNVIVTNLNRAINNINSLCPNKGLTPLPIRNINVTETDTGFVDNGVNNIVTQTSNIPIGSGVASDSVFYRDVNVSDSDLDKRLDIVQDLVSRQLDTITGIKEAPSKVISGNQNPTNTDGNVGDYFINLSTGDIFGPKNNDGTWN